MRNSAAWFLAAFVLVGLIVLVRQPLPRGIPGYLWVTTAILGFSLAFGNYAITVAYASKGKASVITPLVGMYPLVSIPAALLFFGESVGPRESLGALLALTSIVAMTRKRRPDTLRSSSGDITCDGADAAETQAAPPGLGGDPGGTNFGRGWPGRSTTAPLAPDLGWSQVHGVRSARLGSRIEVSVIPVSAPLPDVARHVVQPKRRHPQLPFTSAIGSVSAR